MQNARDYTSRLQQIWEDAQCQATRSQQKQKAQADKHRREEDFQVGDEVYITTKYWKTDRPSRKLANQASGPYKIIEKVGHAYRLHLPAYIKVHPVFSPDKLRLAHKTEPLTGQIQDPTPPEVVNSDLEWEVEEILAVRLRYRKLQYRARWVGHEEPDDTWYLAADFKNAPEKLMAFHRRYPDLPGPPKRLQHWIEAALEDRFEPDYPDDNKPV